jgi:hypothetical protein
MPSVSKLFDAVYDAPEDDAPREALAAHLRKKKDPRGEFIAIQLAEARGEATPAMSRRAAALLAKHEDKWLETFEHGIHCVRWARGFPVHGFHTMFQFADRPWRTVRSLVVDIDSRYRFLRGPLVEFVRELTWDGWYAPYGAFARAARMPRLETLRWAGPFRPNDAGWRKGWEALWKFRNLTSVGFDPGVVVTEPWFWKSRVTKRLRHLEIAHNDSDVRKPPRLGALLARATKSSALETMTITDRTRSDKDPEHTFVLEFRRDATGDLSVCTVTRHGKALDVAALEAQLSTLDRNSLSAFEMKNVPPAILKLVRSKMQKS